MFRIKSLTIHQYRGFKPGTHLEFDDGFNIIIGKNATGKSTLLDLLRSFNFCPDESAHFSYEIVLDDFLIKYSLQYERDDRGSHEKRHKEKLPAFHCSVSKNEVDLLDYDFDGHSSKTEFFGKKLTIQTSDCFEIYLHFGLDRCIKKIALQLEDESQLNTLELSALNELLSKLDNKFTVNLMYDEGLNYFDEIVSKSGSSILCVKLDERSNYWLSVVSANIPSKWISKITEGVRGELVPSGVEIRASDALSLFPPNFDTQTTLRTNTVRCIFQLARASSDERMYHNPHILIERDDGSILTVDKLSYGEKRLIAFFWYLQSTHSVCFVDELANGMHHSWIGACVDAMKDRQVFATSQNPLLLEQLEFANKDEVKRRFIVTASEINEAGKRELTLRNPTDEEAEDFFRSFDGGFQTVAEILKENDLW